MKSFLLKTFRKSNRGQALFLIAFAMVGITAFAGLLVDGGMMLVEYGKLKRGIDAAAIASAQQFRKGFSGADLAAAARNFLALNESEADNIVIYRCKDEPADDGTVNDPELCTEPRRKLMRIEATRTLNFGLLRVIGIDGTTISTSSIGEAASIDLVMIIDTSTSMAYDTYTGPGATEKLNVIDTDTSLPVPDENPAYCNYDPNPRCQPLEDVKDVALEFMDTMFFPYDRVSVVALTSQTSSGTRDHTTVLELSNDQGTVEAAISSLKVFEPPDCISLSGSPDPAFGPCINHNAGGDFIGYDCPLLRTSGDPSSCNSSNIGGALWRAAAEFSNPSVVYRPDAFWVVIMLAGGPANVTDPYQWAGTDGTGSCSPDGLNPAGDDCDYTFGFCPVRSWNDGSYSKCRDLLASERHTLPDDEDTYDADDYARDRADFVANPVTGNGLTIFTIGLGNLIRGSTLGEADMAEQLLIYIAEEAGDELPGIIANHGFYSYAPDTAGLDIIFERIGENIRTRIAK